MSSPSIPLQIAIIAALDNALDCDVWDAVPPDSPYPYVTVDTTEVSNRDYLASRLDERFVYLNVWSTAQGQAEVLGIMADIDAAMNNQRLSLGSGRAFGVRVTRQRTTRESDNLTFMGQVTLRVLTQH